MQSEQIMPGQRWVSDAEPELGLGVVMSAGSGRVSILFPAADDRREYALETAPVRRVAFEVGDNLKTHDGQSGAVEDVKEESGFLHYQVKLMGGSENMQILLNLKPLHKLLVLMQVYQDLVLQLMKLQMIILELQRGMYTAGNLMVE